MSEKRVRADNEQTAPEQSGRIELAQKARRKLRHAADVHGAIDSRHLPDALVEVKDPALQSVPMAVVIGLDAFGIAAPGAERVFRLARNVVQLFSATDPAPAHCAAASVMKFGIRFCVTQPGATSSG